MKELIIFGANWCGPCRTMIPIEKKLAQKYDGKVNFRPVDVDKHPDIASQYNVTSIPMFVLLKDGAPVKSMIGATNEATLERLINS